MIGRGNRSIRRKPVTVSLCPPETPMLPGREPGPPRWEASVQRLELRHGLTVYYLPIVPFYREICTNLFFINLKLIEIPKNCKPIVFLHHLWSVFLCFRPQASIKASVISVSALNLVPPGRTQKVSNDI
jgi:hypothetical protein